MLLAACLTAAAADNDMVVIPAGAFTMGSDDGPQDERPAHHVSLGPFAIDRVSVSNAQFAEFLEAHGPRDARGERFYDDDDPDARIHRAGGRWRPDAGFENHPAVEVTWLGAKAYCEWRGKRLPTEVEWQKGGARRRCTALPVGERTTRCDPRALWRRMERDGAGR
jgi:iron(II)-dependent oxidoreductase